MLSYCLVTYLLCKYIFILIEHYLRNKLSQNSRTIEVFLQMARSLLSSWEVSVIWIISDINKKVGFFNSNVISIRINSDFNLILCMESGSYLLVKYWVFSNRLTHEPKCFDFFAFKLLIWFNSLESDICIMIIYEFLVIKHVGQIRERPELLLFALSNMLSNLCIKILNIAETTAVFRAFWGPCVSKSSSTTINWIQITLCMT